jgi:hypothetical protein
MNKLKFLIIASLLLIGLSCRKDDINDETPEQPEQPTEEGPLSFLKPKTDLKGSQWKLSGYVDAQTGEMIAAEPVDCERCYTFTFDTDYSGFGYSIMNYMFYLAYPVTVISVMTLAGDDDIGNAKLFYDTIKKVQRTERIYGEDEMKFYYNDGKNYLLYKRVKP